MSTLGIAVEAVGALRGNIRLAMEERGKNATGGTARTIAVIPSGGTGFGQASLEADKTWRWVGSGRGPGRMPPVAPIKAWIEARGLKLNAFAVARKIGEEGSRDFRLGRKNIFLEEIGAWERKDIPKAEEKLADELEQRVLKAIDEVKFN